MWRLAALLCVASQFGVVAKRQLDIDLEEPRRILRKYFGELGTEKYDRLFRQADGQSTYEAFVALEADDMNELGIEPHAALSILAAIADGARARKKLVTADFVDGVAKHQSVLEETLREHREEIARLRLRRGDVPEDLRCPLTLELLCDPVTAADGHTYERVAIEEWLATGSRTSPSTGQPLQSTALIPQFTVKRLVVAFMETRRSSVDGDVP